MSNNDEKNATERINKMLIVQSLLHLDGHDRLAPAVEKLKAEGAYPMTEIDHYDRAFDVIAETLGVVLRETLDNGGTFEQRHSIFIPTGRWPESRRENADPDRIQIPDVYPRFGDDDDDDSDFSVWLPDGFSH